MVRNPNTVLKMAFPQSIPESRWELVQQLLKHPRRISKSTTKVNAPKLYIKKIKSGMLRDFIVLDSSWKSKDIHNIFK